MLIDTHAHIHVKEFDQDREAVIQRSRDAGVGIIVNVGFDPAGNEQAAQLAGRCENIYWTAGIHPHNADLATEDNLRKIEESAAGAQAKKLVALGEMGLDYFRNRQPPEVQKNAFRLQLKLARKLNLPVIIHCRDSHKDALKILDEEKTERAVFHCFTGTPAEAQECWERGYLTGITGICTYPKAGNIRLVIKEAPMEKLLIETDCPFLAPQNFRGQRNEPSFVKEVLKKIAQIKGIAEQELESVLERSSKAFFGIS